MVESPKMSLTSESPATVESRAARCFERSVICSPGADVAGVRLVPAQMRQGFS